METSSIKYVEIFLHERLKTKLISTKYREAAMTVLYRLLLNSTYYVELSAIQYKPKNKSWIIKKQYEG